MSTYSEEDLKLAVEKVNSGELSAYSASKQYTIPRTTIVNHVKVKVLERDALFNSEKNKKGR